MIGVRFGPLSRGKFHIAFGDQAALPLLPYDTLCGREPEGRSPVRISAATLRAVYGDRAEERVCKRCLAVDDGRFLGEIEAVRL